jgi:hypothetical protein
MKILNSNQPKGPIEHVTWAAMKEIVSRRCSIIDKEKYARCYLSSLMHNGLIQDFQIITVEDSYIEVNIHVYHMVKPVAAKAIPNFITP